MAKRRIGAVARALGVGIDTLRYYEKCGLLPAVVRTPGGVREYGDKDISRLRFIRRAQRMNFSLEEIGKLLQMREDPQRARNDVRRLAGQKLDEIEHGLAELKTLRDELTLLVNLCRNAEEGCPILDAIEQTDDDRRPRNAPVRD